jgi:hypothetical protein
MDLKEIGLYCEELIYGVWPIVLCILGGISLLFIALFPIVLFVRWLIGTI